jgi:DNA-binding MarR family transcriptional regulator
MPKTIASSGAIPCGGYPGRLSFAWRNPERRGLHGRGCGKSPIVAPEGACYTASDSAFGLGIERKRMTNAKDTLMPVSKRGPLGVAKVKSTDAEHGEAVAPKKSARGRQPIPVKTQPFSEIAASWRRERPDLDLDNLLLMIALTRLTRIVDSRYEAMCLEKFGITGSEVRLLFALRRSGRPFARRPTDLFRALIVTSGAITKQVNRLVAKKLVERTSDPLHAGGFLIHLTQKGLKVANSAAEDQVKNSLIADAMAALTPKQQRQGIEFIEHVLAHVEHTPGATY